MSSTQETDFLNLNSLTQLQHPRPFLFGSFIGKKDPLVDVEDVSYPCITLATGHIAHLCFPMSCSIIGLQGSYLPYFTHCVTTMCCVDDSWN